MCGIIGYIGPRNVVEVLVEGLFRLEYRGYDSAGIAVVDEGQVHIRRVAGKVWNLLESIRLNPLQGRYGVGHTRWATHGRPTEENAHPHRDCTGKIVVVHNGIIENYLAIKHELQSKGHVFRTETDTEVITHLIEEFLKEGHDFRDAVRDTARRLDGLYAFVALHAHENNLLVGVRKGPPLVIGVGQQEYFIASDIPAVLEHTRDFIFLNDEEMCFVTPDGIQLSTLGGDPIIRTPHRVNWDPIMAQKGGFRHFMLKEIYEQPRAVRDTLLGRYSIEEPSVDFQFESHFQDILARTKYFYLVACGTSYHACLIGKHMIEGLAGVPVEVDYASEFRYRTPLVTENSVALFISQSGETADTLAALRKVKQVGIPSIAICNVVGSMITRESDSIIYTHAGPEIGVASTKTFLTQLAVLYLFSLYMGRLHGKLSQDDLFQYLQDMRRLPSILEEVLRMDERIQEIAREYANFQNFLYLGRGIHHPVALEGALKLKEISYIHAEGYAGGEMKHGPIALIDRNVPVVALVPHDHTYEKMIGNLSEVRTRDGAVIAIAHEATKDVMEKATKLITTPHVNYYLDTLVNTIPLQLIAYHIAVHKGCDVDQPRNLAKSVTVE